MAEMNNYYDASHPLHPYTHSLSFTPDTEAPGNALRGEVPTAPAGYRPGESGGEWINIEDHREEEGYVNGQPHTIKDFGPYPDGWSTEPPVPSTLDQIYSVQSDYATQLTAKQEQRATAQMSGAGADVLAEIDGEFQALLQAQKDAIDTLAPNLTLGDDTGVRCPRCGLDHFKTTELDGEAIWQCPFCHFVRAAG